MSDAPRPPPPKRDVALALLEESSMFIHLDPRRPSVLVPKGFTGQHQLVLQVGLNMAIPIPDLTIDETGISCTLSFNRSPFWCRIPWSAIYALVGDDGRGGVWPEDVPPEIQQQKQGSPQGAAARGPGGKRPKPKLAAVGGAGGAEEKADASAGRSRSASSLKTAAASETTEPAKADADPAREGADEAPAEPLAPPTRIGLAAVPPLAAAPPAPEETAEKTGEASTEDPPSEGEGDPAPTRLAPKGAPAKKTKREIPPYLRVIK